MEKEKESRECARLEARNQLRIQNLAQFVQFYNQRAKRENNATGTAAKRFNKFSLVRRKKKEPWVKTQLFFIHGLMFTPQVQLEKEDYDVMSHHC